MEEKNYIVIANWKMNKTSQEAEDFIRQLLRGLGRVTAKVMIAPSFTALPAVASLTMNTPIVAGAQNMSQFGSGAFTGEVSAAMIKGAGARFVILGHSERRQYFFETNEIIRQKVERALVEGIQPVLCIGESLEERDAGKTFKVLNTQMEECLKGLGSSDLRHLMIAYEPVWAIGTGKAADPALIEEVHKSCREFLKTKWSERTGLQMPILYGGSVTPAINKQLLDQPNVDGVLVGSASLDIELFTQLITT